MTSQSRRDAQLQSKAMKPPPGRLSSDWFGVVRLKIARLVE
jgi:hypothetical protein